MPRTLRTDHIATAAQAASPRILIIRRTTGWTSYFSTKLSCFAKRGARAVVQSCLTQDCSIHQHTDGNGIILDLPYGSNTTTPPALVVNNIVWGNGADCIETFGSGSQFVTDEWVVNNTCYSNNLDQSGRGAITAQGTGSSYFVNNIVYLLSSGGVPVNGAFAFDQEPNSTTDTNVEYYNNLYYGTSSCCHQFSSSSSWNGGISGDPQFALAPYFYPSVTSPYNSQYKLGRPPLPMRPAYRQNTICNSTLSNLWVPTCDIDEAFALASTSPGYGNDQRAPARFLCASKHSAHRREDKF